MNFNYIDIDEASINKRLEKCKELTIDNRYKNMYIKMEYISRYIENELEDEDKSKLTDLKRLIYELCKNETYFAYKMGVIDGIKSKNKCI